MAGTPQGTPPDIQDEMDMSWEHTGPAINTTPPSQFLQNIYNPLAADDNYQTLQPAESFDNDPAIAYGVADHNTQARYLQSRGGLPRIGAASRIGSQDNGPRANHRRNRPVYDSINIGPRAINRNAPSRNAQAASILTQFSSDHWRPRRGIFRSQPRQRPGTFTTPIRHVTEDDSRYLSDLLQTRQRLNVNAPSFRIATGNTLHTSPLLQNIQRESLARDQSPRQDRAVASPKRKSSDEPPSDGRSEDKIFQGENYYSTITAVQTTEEGKRRLLSPSGDEKTPVSPRMAPTKPHPSSIYSMFYQDLTRPPGHRPVTPVTPPKFRGNGRSMPGAWPESPITPLSLDTSISSTSLITPPSTPDMSRMPGAWPKSPEPLPFTTPFPTIGTAAITPPESPVDESSSFNMDDVPAGTPEVSATEHSYGSTSVPRESPEIVWPEGPEAYRHRHFDQTTRNTIMILEEIQNEAISEHERRRAQRSRRAQHVNFPENPVTRVKRYAKGEPISYPSPTSTTGSHDETSLLSLSPSEQNHRDLVASTSSSSSASTVGTHDETSLLSLSPSEQNHREFVASTSSSSSASTVGTHDETSLLGLSPSEQNHRESVESASFSSPASIVGTHDETSLLSLSPSEQNHRELVASTSSSSSASTAGTHDETSLLGLSPSVQNHRELVVSASPSSPASSHSSDDDSPPPSLGPSPAPSPRSDDGWSPRNLGSSPASERPPVATEHPYHPVDPFLSPIEHSHTPIEHSITPTEQLYSPVEDPSTPINVNDALSAQLTREFDYFLLRSDRRKAHRQAEQEEAEKVRRAQAAEQAAAQARQAAAEAARQRAESDARKKIEEEEECKKSGRRRLPTESVLKPLTPEWEAKLLDILGKRASEVVAMTSAGNELDRRDIGKVLPQPGTTDDPSGWLNDNVINGYLDSVIDHGLKARGHRRGETPKLHAFNSAFYKNITERGVESVKRWSRRPKISGKDLLKVEHVFIPVNVGGAHWTLLVVSPAWKRIEYFDSLHGSSGAAIRNAKAWIKMELGEAWNEREWEVVEDPALRGRGKGPRQTNGSDCGVFTITTAKMISLGVDPMAITAGDMPLQRKRVVVELANGGFFGEFEPHVVF